MPEVTMYSTGSCPYCQAADRLLQLKGASVRRIRVDLEPERRAEMMSRTGRRTVPQIYIGDLHVGGFEELAELEREGRLESLLRTE
jgi:glutaredoxin 3